MDIEGKITFAFDERSGVSQRTGQPWKIQEFLVSFNDYGSKHMLIQVSDGLNNRIEQFKSLMGKDVRIFFDIDANEYNGRWFNKINAWGVKELETTPPEQEQQKDGE